LEELQADDPRQIGGYTLFARLGSGGMGQVYFGRSLGGRDVAVKVIRADLARDKNFRLRFAREVETARRVSGAFTAPVIDADPDGPIPWLVTGYVNGPSLADAIERHGPLPLSSVLVLAAGLAEGLGAVHGVGVIHRDLKPSNVLLAPDGPRLIDFGISQAADFTQITTTGMVVGTPGFMSPEQILGEPVGPSSDVFTMGAVLAFAATGEQPFGIGSPEVRNQRVLHLGPRLDNLPAELSPLVERCMARDPADRPTASQFLTDLVAAHPEAADQTGWLPEGILARAGRPVPTPPPGRETPPPDFWANRARTSTSAPPPPRSVAPVGEPLRKPKRRRIWVIGAVAAVAVLGTVTGLLVAPSGSPSAHSDQLTAAFNWTGSVNYKETASSDSYFKKVGDTWQDTWNVSSNCGWQACATATLDGAIDGISFTATLTRSGTTYTGSAPIDNYWLDCLHQSNHENTTLSIKLLVTRAGTVYQSQWSITAFTGAVTWNVPSLPDGCADSLYQMQVNGNASS
jgi:serine/threonine protein kinase